jgi:hypothetical protein
MTELESLCLAEKITCSSLLDGAEPTTEWQKDSFSWRVVLQYQGRKLATDYFTGKALVHSYGFRLPKTPKPWDVLFSLCSDAIMGNMSFKEFCNEFGYDEDSRKAEATYKQCVQMSAKLKVFLGDKLETFCHAEH